MMWCSDRDDLRSSVTTGSVDGHSGSLKSYNGKENPAFTNCEQENVWTQPSKQGDAVSVSTESGRRVSVTGTGSLRPGCLRWVAGGPKAFAFWSMLYFLLKVSGNVYLGTIIDTIEKQFELSSTESGALAILNDAMDLALVVFVAYFGQSRHRPRIIAVGSVIAGLGVLTCAVPHLRLPPYTSAPLGCNDTDQFVDYCSDDPKDKANPCFVEFEQPAEKPIVWLIIGQIMLGIGNVPIKPLGTTYIDDAVGKHTTPVYLAFLFIAGSGGSVGGLLLGSLTNSIFVDFDRVAPEDRPSFPQTDPRYIGAWWLGFVIIGCAVLLISVPFFFFPRHLPKTKERIREEEQHAEEAKENGFQETRDDGIELELDELSASETGSDGAKDDRNKAPFMKRLSVILKKMLYSYKTMLTNVPLLLLCLTTAASSAITSGFGTFALKYFRVELGISTSLASQLAIVVVACMAAGNVIGGLIIRRWKLSPAQCTFILIFGEVVAILCMPAFLLVGCNTKPVAGVSTNYAAPAPFDGLPEITQPLIFPDSVQQAVSPCNVNCTCGNEDYSPVCGADGITYVSSCYAGCEVVERAKDDRGKWINSFSECRCIQPGGVNATAIDGECADDCPDWVVPFIITICAAMFFSSSLGKTGLALITLRIVDDDMRATALGFQTLVLNLLGYFPAPLYFGAAINLACILWGYSNGDRGACWFYDIDLFRYSFQGLIGGIRVISVLVLFGVFYTLRNVKEKERKEEQLKKTETE
ncbi:solute carrier organic anion transporter family member 2A1-like [Patiria miniata]|uniref:Solute carrier organic anion transporter family member n=1 Tax=Patiria miniata TaxID=46514 RepID=A0A913ZEK6_PATMI|nr:solute carrier organic anion transporter family member 2A1-like [Patiria miniata]